MSTDGKAEEVKAARNRSPNHPSMTLEEAIERAKTLHAVYGRTPMGNALAVAKWGYSNPRSSGALQTLATVKSYGLIDATGLGQAQKVAVTEAAERIIRNAPNRNELVKAAALAPALNKEVWEKYDHNLPHDDAIKEYLKWERPEGTCFTVDETVEAYIERLRTTLQYAGLIPRDGSPSLENNFCILDIANNKTDPETPKPLVRVGSYVQWTSNGQHQFEAPRKVAGIQDGWALIEGSETGVPMSELTVLDPPSENKSPPANPFYKKPEDRPAYSGPRIEFPLPDGNSIEIRLKKPVSKKDFDRIIKLVQLSEDSLVGEPE
jgi:hypothetical protein